MNQTKDWISFSIYSSPKVWPHLLRALDDFLNSDPICDLTVTRIIEFNYLFGSNIRLFVMPAAGKSLPLTAQMQTFFRSNINAQVAPGMQAKIPTGNTAALAIRALLSDVIIAAFQTESMDDEALFTIALYLHLTLLKKNNVAIASLVSHAGTVIFTEEQVAILKDLESEFNDNRELLYEMQSDVIHYNIEELPVWLPVWIKGYETLTGTMPEHIFPALYRCTTYFIMKQLGLTVPLIMRLEYFIKKMADTEIV